jgi:hypothetical protein
MSFELYRIEWRKRRSGSRVDGAASVAVSYDGRRRSELQVAIGSDRLFGRENLSVVLSSTSATSCNSLLLLLMLLLFQSAWFSSSFPRFKLVRCHRMMARSTTRFRFRIRHRRRKSNSRFNPTCNRFVSARSFLTFSRIRIPLCFADCSFVYGESRIRV